MLNFDDNLAWGPHLAARFGNLISESVVQQLKAAQPEFVQDACEFLFSIVDRGKIIDATLAWIRTSTIACYHGSRLTASEVDSINARGLAPLIANDRRARLRRALSRHPRWGEVADRLDAAIVKHGPGEGAGRREGQVHLTLSRWGLINGFNRYLTHGSEFDQRVAHDLLGSDGEEMLRKDGQARVVQFAVPGDAALNAVNRFNSVNECLARGLVPHLVREFLEAWSYGMAFPEFPCKSLQLDCGMVFRATLPPCWIVDIETLSI